MSGGRPTMRVDGDPIECDADEEAGDEHRRQGGIDREAGVVHQKIEPEHAGDDHRTMGEVDHVDHAPDERIPIAASP